MQLAQHLPGARFGSPASPLTSEPSGTTRCGKRGEPLTRSLAAEPPFPAAAHSSSSSGSLAQLLDLDRTHMAASENLRFGSSSADSTAMCGGTCELPRTEHGEDASESF